MQLKLNRSLTLLKCTTLHLYKMFEPIKSCIYGFKFSVAAGLMHKRFNGIMQDLEQSSEMKNE